MLTYIIIYLIGNIVAYAILTKAAKLASQDEDFRREFSSKYTITLCILYSLLSWIGVLILTIIFIYNTMRDNKYF